MSSIKTEEYSLKENYRSMAQHRMGKVISADGDNFVCYSRYGTEFTVTKGLTLSFPDSEESYQNNIYFQTLLSEKGFAPRLLKKDMKVKKKGNIFVMWISEDAGLPIEDEDIPACNILLDKLYDEGIIVTPYVLKSWFIKGFDGNIRMTDFTLTEQFDEPIETKDRKYLRSSTSKPSSTA